MSGNLSGTGAISKRDSGPAFGDAAVARVNAWPSRLRSVFLGRTFRVTSPPKDGGGGRSWPSSLPRPVRRALSLRGSRRGDLPVRVSRRLVSAVGAYLSSTRGRVAAPLALAAVARNYDVAPAWLARQFRRGVS